MKKREIQKRHVGVSSFFVIVYYLSVIVTSGDRLYYEYDSYYKVITDGGESMSGYDARIQQVKNDPNTVLELLI